MRTLLALTVVFAFASTAVIPPLQTNYFLCQLCRATVDVVAPKLNASIPELEQLFIQKCTEFLGALPLAAEECKLLAEREIEPLKKELEGGVTAEEVCKLAHAC
ncbi:unnamed protein product [Nippostrongylus brasiliensis]|uniref:Saposin B-type domain-containing protein n=1 Tax=Nippostrongylus brasiliensis TaxID=27835 RepID=A0A0N4YHW4_NIPBR|nr:unnamed protein product [Nippostrongylus brasiliensis]